MAGSHDEAGRPSPLTKTIRCCPPEEGRLMAGKKVYEIGAVGLLGRERSSGEGKADIVSDFIVTSWLS